MLRGTVPECRNPKRLFTFGQRWLREFAAVSSRVRPLGARRCPTRTRRYASARERRICVSVGGWRLARARQRHAHSRRFLLWGLPRHGDPSRRVRLRPASGNGDMIGRRLVAGKCNFSNYNPNAAVDNGNISVHQVRRRDAKKEAPQAAPSVGPTSSEPHIRKTPNSVSGIGAFSAAERPSARTRRVSSGSMIPSSQRRAVE
jgi:hypothetical protein